MRASADTPHRDRALLAFAAGHHGIVDVADLHDLGFDRGAIARRIRSGRLHRLHPGVYGVPDVKWGEAVKAVVEVKPAGRYTAQQVTDFVGTKIARFKRPHVVVFTDALPRTAEGAVDRDAVKAKWGAGAGA